MISTIFNQSGNVARIIETPSEETLTHNIGTDETAVNGDWSGHYLDAGQLVPIPPIPPYCHWQPETRTVSEPDIASLHADAAKMIDDAAALVYGRFTRFDQEYVAREEQALAYRAAGYAGEVPRQVAAFAAPAGLPAQQAADTILSQAAMLRGAIEQLGELRMRKYEVYAAATVAEKLATRDAVLIAIQAFWEQLT